MSFDPIVGNYMAIVHPPKTTVPCSFCQYESRQGGTRSHRAVVTVHGISAERQRLVQLSWCKDCLADMGMVVISTLADWDRVRFARIPPSKVSYETTEEQPPCPGTADHDNG